MTTVVGTKRKTYTVAVVGATGAVGREMIRMLELRKFPVRDLKLFASSKSRGKHLTFRGKRVRVESIQNELLSGIDIALFSAGATVSKEFAPIFAEHGIFVIDNSSAWRMNEDVPLVVPEVNSHTLNANTKIIANPNCSTIQLMVTLKPIHDAAHIKSVRVATYQSVSGAGARGIEDLDVQSRAWARGKKIPPSKKIPHQIAFNLVPQIDVFVEDDYTKEEIKIVNETRKILESPEMLISATCVRVPIFRAHSEAVWIETERKISVEETRELLRNAPGVVLQDDPAKSIYPMPFHASGRQETFVGRIRKDLVSPHGLLLWVVSDNLLKGAALNAVQIAEKLIEKGSI